MAQFTTIEEWSESIVGRAADYKSAVEYTPMWLNWQSSWFVISRLSVRVRSSALYNLILNCIMGRFPSGQRGQTVNLLQIASVVRIHLHPFALMSSMEQCLARKSMQSSITQCVRWCGGIGRRKGLKIPRGQLRAGSSPATSINLRVGETLILQRFSYFWIYPL